MSSISLKLFSAGLLSSLVVAASATAWSQTQAGTALHHLDKKIEGLRLREHSLKRLLAEGQSEQEVLRRRVIARGRAYYKLARGVPSGDFFEHAVRVERLRRGILHDLAAIKGLGTRRAQAGAGLTELEQKKAPLEQERRVTGRAHDALLSQKERDAAFRRAFGQTKSKDHTAIYGAEQPQAERLESFSSMRGRLAFPLAGRAEVREMTAANGARLLAFESVVTASVRTVAAGRVLQTGNAQTGGQFALLDHGEGYSSLISGIEGLSVSIGDDLPAHARLGNLPASEASSERELTIELRRNDHALAPADWFGL